MDPVDDISKFGVDYLDGTVMPGTDGATKRQISGRSHANRELLVAQPSAFFSGESLIKDENTDKQSVSETRF